MKSLRETLIERGIITPSREIYLAGERPRMSAGLVAKLKERLIKNGVLIPYRLKLH